jgi:hypothetical protein
MLTQREKPIKDLRLQWAFGAVFVFGMIFAEIDHQAKITEVIKSIAPLRQEPYDKDEGIAGDGSFRSIRSCCRTRATQDFSLGLHWMCPCRALSFSHGTTDAKMTFGSLQP